MKKLCAVALALGLFLVSGCDGDEDFSRYPSVGIPGYEMKDYFK